MDRNCGMVKYKISVRGRQGISTNKLDGSKSEGEAASPSQLIVAKQDWAQCCQFHFTWKQEIWTVKQEISQLKKMHKKSRCEEDKISVDYTQSSSNWLVIIATIGKGNGVWSPFYPDLCLDKGSWSFPKVLAKNPVLKMNARICSLLIFCLLSLNLFSYWLYHDNKCFMSKL